MVDNGGSERRYPFVFGVALSLHARLLEAQQLCNKYATGEENARETVAAWSRLRMLLDRLYGGIASGVSPVSGQPPSVTHVWLAHYINRWVLLCHFHLQRNLLSKLDALIDGIAEAARTADRTPGAAAVDEDGEADDAGAAGAGRAAQSSSARAADAASVWRARAALR